MWLRLSDVRTVSIGKTTTMNTLIKSADGVIMKLLTLMIMAVTEN